MLAYVLNHPLMLVFVTAIGAIVIAAVAVLWPTEARR